jgi:hypothetical protein
MLAKGDETHGIREKSDRRVGTHQEKIAVALTRPIESSETFTRALRWLVSFYPRARAADHGIRGREGTSRRPNDRILWAGVTGEQDG